MTDSWASLQCTYVDNSLYNHLMKMFVSGARAARVRFCRALTGGLLSLCFVLVSPNSAAPAMIAAAPAAPAAPADAAAVTPAVPADAIILPAPADAPVPAAFAAVAAPFASAEHERRYYQLLKELRCLVCQNQSLSDSDAALAGDLRAEVRRMIDTGAGDDEIMDFMTARYGDFVLFRPRFKAATWVLWLAPFALLAAGLWWLFRWQNAHRRCARGVRERGARA